MNDTNLPFIYRILRSLEKNRLQKASELISGVKLSVLELGCNNGRFLYENKNKWKNITGVDIDRDKLKIAKRKIMRFLRDFLI